MEGPMEEFLLIFDDYQILRVALLLIAFGIFLPTLDTYSDIGLSYSFFTGTYEPYCEKRRVYENGWPVGYKEWCAEAEKHPIYGSMILFPILVATLFTSFHWCKREDTTRKKLFTLPLLIGQLWPQWQVLKVLWMMKKRDGHWKAEREKLQKDISSLGKQN